MKLSDLCMPSFVSSFIYLSFAGILFLKYLIPTALFLEAWNDGSRIFRGGGGGRQWFLEKRGYFTVACIRKNLAVKK